MPIKSKTKRTRKTRKTKGGSGRSRSLSRNAAEMRSRSRNRSRPAETDVFSKDYNRYKAMPHEQSRLNDLIKRTGVQHTKNALHRIHVNDGTI